MWFLFSNSLSYSLSLFQLYEQYKSEFEENLAKKTDSLMKEMEDMFPHLEVLDMMDNAENIRDYVKVSFNEPGF